MDAQQLVVESRQQKRYPLKVPVVMHFVVGQASQNIRGTTNEVSLSGCSLFTEFNIRAEQHLTLYLSLPSAYSGGPRSILEVTARVVYTVLASGQQQFRCGLQFLNFKDDGRSVLSKLLQERAQSGF